MAEAGTDVEEKKEAGLKSSLELELEKLRVSLEKQKGEWDGLEAKYKKLLEDDTELAGEYQRVKEAMDHAKKLQQDLVKASIKVQRSCMGDVVELCRIKVSRENISEDDAKDLADSIHAMTAKTDETVATKIKELNEAYKEVTRLCKVLLIILWYLLFCAFITMIVVKCNQEISMV